MLIGRREFVGLPDLHIQAIEAKIDTGAYTSALHCSIIDPVSEKNRVRFKLLDEDYPEYNDVLFDFPIHKIKTIRSSNGTLQKRYIIRTHIQIGNTSILTDFSLTDRSAMRYPVLIGRKALKGNFIVDVQKIHTAGNPHSTTL